MANFSERSIQKVWEKQPTFLDNTLTYGVKINVKPGLEENSMVTGIVNMDGR